jgi:hypothetical protein
MKIFPLEMLATRRDQPEVGPKTIFVQETFAILGPAKKITRANAGFSALCDVLERTPMPTLSETVVEPIVLHRVDLPIERFIADAGGPSHRYFEAIRKLQSLGHSVAKRDVPLAGCERLGRAIQVAVQGGEGENLELRLRIRVGAEREEVVEVRCRYERGHVRERLQEAISYLLMHPKLDHLLHSLYVDLAGTVPKRNRPQGFVPAQAFVGLHTLLVPAPMNRPGRALLDVVDHFIDRDRPAAGRVPAEDPVRHHFGVDKARVGQDHARYTLSVASNGVTNNFRFYHRKEEEPDRLVELMNELSQRLAIPREMFTRCAVCNSSWGTCEHSGNQPVDVDSEAMTLLYEKIGETPPVYPPSWADFWYACRDIYKGK